MRRLALDPMNIPAVQAWLEDWAAKGWYLERYGRNLVSFTQGERQKDVRYRLQPVGSGGGEPDQDTREAYREMGWTYVCSTVVARGLFAGVRTEFHIWRCEDPAAPELDTDQALREEAYGDLLRTGWRNIWLGALLIAALLAVMCWSIWDHPRQFLVEEHPSSLILMLCWDSLLLLHLIDRSVRLIRFTRRLRQEEPAPQRAPWGRARARVRASQGLYALILVVMVGNLFRPSGSRRYFQPVSQYDEPVPYVSLAELGTPAEGEVEALDFHSIWGKSVWWTLEGDYEHLEENDDGPLYSTEYYSLRIPCMAVNLEEQILGRLYVMDIREHPEFQVRVPGVDSAWYWRDELEEWQFLLLRRGGQVLDVQYRGEADLIDHADRYVEMLERFR